MAGRRLINCAAYAWLPECCSAGAEGNVPPQRPIILRSKGKRSAAVLSIFIQENLRESEVEWIFLLENTNVLQECLQVDDEKNEKTTMGDDDAVCAKAKHKARCMCVGGWCVLSACVVLLLIHIP